MTTRAANTQHGVEDAALDPPHDDLQAFSRIRAYARKGRMPWRRLKGRRRMRLINACIVSREAAGDANGKPFPLHENRYVDAKRFQTLLYKRFARDIGRAAVSSLYECKPDLSAYRLFDAKGVFFLIAGLAAFVAALIKWPISVLISLNALATIYFICVIVFRMLLLALNVLPGKPRNTPDAPADKAALPVITILLPLYKDAAALPALSQAIDRLDYPAAKKDVKLLLEESDAETIAEAKRLGLDRRHDLITVPAGGPQTKPKACNYGLHLARGEIIVIYDAEDQPESDQLRKAVAAFARGDERLACVQAKLNYYNANDNWLTRLFTLEYSLWFDWLLPALQRMNAPIPLGGTSNFFRIETLIELGGWDPYNVTEDADLGLRLAKLGYRTEILDSTTYEEANSRTGNWIRQRSRWMKGHLQTWIVHMRRPDAIVAHTGWTGLLSIQLFLAGNVFSALINPILWMLFILWFAFKPAFIAALFPDPLLSLNLFALMFGNAFFILLMAIAPLKRGWYGLCLAALTAPLYWLYASAAGYKAVWQLIFRPHFWEKTDHLLSEKARAKRREALISMEAADRP